MAVIKRQKSDGSWEYIQSIGQKVLTAQDLDRIETDFKTHESNDDIHIKPEERTSWNNKQDELHENQMRSIYVQPTKPSAPKENDIWIELE